MAVLRAFLTTLTASLGLVLSLPVVLIGLPFWGVSATVRAGAWLQRRLRPQPSPWQDLVQFEPIVGWRPRAELRAHAEGSRVFHVTTDAGGWRGHTALADADIVVFGDSFAFGHGADDRDFFAEVRSRPTIKAIGSNGYNLVQSLFWMERLAPQLEGKLVAWFVYYGNDLYENLRPNLDRYRMPFVRQVAGTTSWEIVTSHVREEPWPFPTQRRYHERLAEICCPTFLSQRAFAAVRHLAERGREVCREVGADLAIIGIPDITQINAEGIRRLEGLAPAGHRPDVSLPDRRLREICAQLGLPFVALRDHLGPEDHLQGDCHWSRGGHRKVAALLAGLHAEHEVSSAPVHAGGRAAAPLQEAVIR